MKRIAILLIISFCSMSSVSAGTFMNLAGGAYRAGDAGTLWGGELGAGWDLSPEFSFIIHPGFYGNREDGGEPAETVRAIGSLTAGIQYRYQVKDLPLYWTGCAALGGAYYYEQGPKRTGPFIDPSTTVVSGDFGPSLLIRTGVLYYLDQRLGIVGEIGYGRSFFFDDFKDDRIGGFQVLAGIRFTITGKNRSIYDRW